MKKEKSKLKKGILITFILDETGSMESCKQETIIGFNKYIDEIKKTNDKAKFSLLKFNSTKQEMVYLNKSLKDVPKLTMETYLPNNFTPLYDAIGTTISKVDEIKEGNKLIVILTDGLENASKVYNRQKILELIKEKEKQGWTFAYLGANQDAYIEGTSMGILNGNTQNFNTKQMGKTFACLSSATT